jgi:L-aminopeptidase/D-esterase-like protein
MNDTITVVDGITVGNYTDLQAATGCTVVLCPPGTVGAVDVRGGAPGTRETDLLESHRQVQHVDAIVLSGGSAFGLAVADGVMRYLKEKGIGYPAMPGVVVPIVPAAILFDLGLGASDIWPSADDGYAAAASATADPVLQGSVGAGTGAMIGGIMGPAMATKGGLGSHAIWINDEIVVAALVAVNAVGDVVEEDGRILAGLRTAPGSGDFMNMMNVMGSMVGMTDQAGGRNTVIAVIATNARLDQALATRVAQMAQDGIAHAVRPAHTLLDGDTVFVLATGVHPANPSVIGAYAAEALAVAIRKAVRAATTLGDAVAIGDHEAGNH